MAVISPPQPEAGPPPSHPSSPQGSQPAVPAQERKGPDPRFTVPGAALTLLAALLLGFAAHLTVLGHIEHARAQQTGYDRLRDELALGTAPVGPRDQQGRPVPNGAPVAVLHIPAIGLREVVFQGTSSEVLMSGPGHLRNTPLPGQPGTSTILGRQWGYGSPFNHLDQLRAGDPITVTTGQGQQHYTVTGTRRAGDQDPVALTAGQGRLTLVTATGGYYTPHGVLRVDARLVGQAQPAPAAGGAVPAAELPLAGDQSAWLPVLLWLQALLVATVAVSWAYRRWGRWQTWIAGLPVLTALVIALSGAATALLPNLM
ncbi:LPXTG-site transpeptidase (sortase) family protein [Actinacidiphila yanglinensis]|uniref:LPXTG-site transpeptidase (Sortase) family protein n=1 Tax=Actinacidiphila yanglinensis TaxID=310779 RepID=A0A1H5W682_9ACTN|nr:class E sortase [Actinacidiphila yanglinensis]SEF94848.1 LPXTG-site transpeptidase (sortase) family protein [Actinacidiphila yanglinensis]